MSVKKYCDSIHYNYFQKIHYLQRPVENIMNIKLFNNNGSITTICIVLFSKNKVSSSSNTIRWLSWFMFGPNTQITKYFECPNWFQTCSKCSYLCVFWTKSWHVWTDYHLLKSCSYSDFCSKFPNPPNFCHFPHILTSW